MTLTIKRTRAKHRPTPSKIHRGPAELERRRAEAALLYQHVRIERQNFEQFRQLAANGQSAEQLINQALREWLSAQGMREMLRTEIQLAVRQSLSGIQPPSEHNATELAHVG